MAAARLPLPGEGKEAAVESDPHQGGLLDLRTRQGLVEGLEGLVALVVGNDVATMARPPLTNLKSHDSHCQFWGSFSPEKTRAWTSLLF